MLEAKAKKQAAILGGRIGFLFLIASGFLILAAYFILSKNLQNLLTGYTTGLVQSMVEQGVTMVEYELQVSQGEAALLADTFQAPVNEGEAEVFPTAFSQSDILHAVYVAKKRSSVSDGGRSGLRDREDIKKAFGGETAVYGPY